MSKTVEISREPFEAANPVPWGVFWNEPDQRYMTTAAHFNCLEYNGKWTGWKSALLAAPAVERQAEPIYQMRYLGDGGGGWFDMDKDEFNRDKDHKNYHSRTVFTSLLAPVAVVLPERRTIDWMENRGDEFSEGFNYCLDKVKELNK